MNPPRLAVVVLSWNAALDTLRCLEALEASDAEGFEVVVVDNASTDGSVAVLRARHPGLTLLENRENLGYAGGNNVGIRYAQDRGAGYVLLLNDDAVVAPNALSALLDAARNHPGVGFLGPKVMSLEEPSRFLSAGGILDREWRSSHRGAGELDVGQYDELAQVDWLSGCALLVSREAIRRAGTLDPEFFAYYEDVEWCVRGRQAGLGVLFVPDARVWHPDTRVQQSDSPLVTYYMARNSLLFLAKHCPGTGLLLRRLGSYLYRLASWSIRPRWRHKRRQRDALLRAVLDFGRRRFGRAERLV